MAPLVIDDAIELMRTYAVWCRWLDVSVIESHDPGRPEALGVASASRYRVVATDKSGSAYACLVDTNGDENDGPIVFFGSEGERRIVTANASDFVALLALGVSPAAFSSGSRRAMRAPNQSMLGVLRERYERNVATADLVEISDRASRICFRP